MKAKQSRRGDNCFLTNLTRGKQKNFILIPLLVISLVVFNFPAISVLAEEVPTDAPADTTLSQDAPAPAETPAPTENPAPPEDVVIDTGDANGGIEVENSVNTNIAQLGDPAESQTDWSELEGEVQGQADEAAQTEAEETGETETQETAETLGDNPPAEPEEELAQGVDNSNDEENNDGQNTLDITNDNQADVGNDVVGVGSTGDNQAEGEACDVDINTGAVNLYTYLINIVNTNIFASDFSQFLLNLFEGLQGDIDLSSEIASSAEGCLGDDCIDNINITNNNNGTTTNDVLLDGSSGGNTAQSNGGSATINTGDVNVVANVLNILNSNIVGANWTQFIINVFGDWMGDLVLPGKDQMQDQFGNSGSACCGDLSITNSNQGQIINDVSVISDTGLNTTQGDGGSINTGDAQADVNVFNIANTNITGNNFFLMKVNNFGDWNGSIFSLPPGFFISQDGMGFEIINAGSSSGVGISGSDLNITNNNAGAIINRVIINAFTGGNTAQSSGGSASINTGDAQAIVNLMNIMNTNIVGNNFLLGMVNIFGNWQGNLAFGRPDNWIGSSAATLPDPVSPGGEIAYNLAYTNKGNADASNVLVKAGFNKGIVEILNSGGGFIDEAAGEIIWNVGDLSIGETGAVSYAVQVKDDVQNDVKTIDTTSSISSLESDNNSQDNTDTLSVALYRGSSLGALVGGPNETLPNMKLTQANNAYDGAWQGGSISFSTKLFNDSSGSSYDTILYNNIRSVSSTDILDTQQWNLGKVFPNEEITIDFAIVVGENLPPGEYLSFTQAAGKDASGNASYSTIASSVFKVVEAPDTENVASEEAAELNEEENSQNNIVSDIKDVVQEILAPLRPKTISASDENGPAVVREVSASNEQGGVLGDLQEESNNRRSLNLFSAIGSLGWWGWLIILAILAAFLILLFLTKKRKKEESY